MKLKSFLLFITVSALAFVSACHKENCDYAARLEGHYTGSFISDQTATTDITRTSDNTFAMLLSYSETGGYRDSIMLDHVSMASKDHFSFTDSSGGFLYSGYGNLDGSRLEFSISDSSAFGFGTKSFIGNK